jgi:hypothetical protein
MIGWRLTCTSGVIFFSRHHSYEDKQNNDYQYFFAQSALKTYQRKYSVYLQDRNVVSYLDPFGPMTKILSQ